jgi:hypothetical protein
MIIDVPETTPPQEGLNSTLDFDDSELCILEPNPERAPLLSREQTEPILIALVRAGGKIGSFTRGGRRRLATRLGRLAGNGNDEDHDKEEKLMDDAKGMALAGIIQAIINRSDKQLVQIRLIPGNPAEEITDDTGEEDLDLKEVPKWVLALLENQARLAARASRGTDDEAFAWMESEIAEAEARTEAAEKREAELKTRTAQLEAELLATQALADQSAALEAKNVVLSDQTTRAENRAENAEAARENALRRVSGLREQHDRDETTNRELKKKLADERAERGRIVTETLDRHRAETKSRFEEELKKEVMYWTGVAAEELIPRLIENPAVQNFIVAIFSDPDIINSVLVMRDVRLWGKQAITNRTVVI